MKVWIDVTWELLVHSKHVVKSRWSILLIYMCIVACSLIETWTFQVMELLLIPFYLFIILTLSRLYFINRLFIDGKFWVGLLWFMFMVFIFVVATVYYVNESHTEVVTVDAVESSQFLKVLVITLLAGTWYAILIPAVVVWSIVRCGIWNLSAGYAVVFGCRTPNARKALLVLVVLSITSVTLNGSDLLMLPVAMAWVDRYALMNRPKKKEKAKQASLKTVEAL